MNSANAGSKSKPQPPRITAISTARATPLTGCGATAATDAPRNSLITSQPRNQVGGFGRVSRTHHFTTAIVFASHDRADDPKEFALDEDPQDLAPVEERQAEEGRIFSLGTAARAAAGSLRSAGPRDDTGRGSVGTAGGNFSCRHRRHLSSSWSTGNSDGPKSSRYRSRIKSTLLFVLSRSGTAPPAPERRAGISPRRAAAAPRGGCGPREVRAGRHCRPTASR